MDNSKEYLHAILSNTTSRRLIRIPLPTPVPEAYANQRLNMRALLYLFIRVFSSLGWM